MADVEECYEIVRNRFILASFKIVILVADLGECYCNLSGGSRESNHEVSPRHRQLFPSTIF